MVKRLQAMKAKKGFTLVELIVVIAIIGVLAAILVPTMLGFVTSANVTSANSTAASIQDQVDSWLTKLDTKSHGMKQANGQVDMFSVVVAEAAGGAVTWTVTAPTITTAWNGAAVPICSTGYSNTKAPASSSTAQLAVIEALEPLFPDMKNATFVCYLEAGKCVGVAYIPAAAAATDITDKSFAPDTAAATFVGDADFFKFAAADWGSTDGVLTTGEICGTSPAIVR